MSQTVNSQLLKMTDVELKNKIVLIREDFNVPIENGQILHDARLLAALPTLEYALSKGAKVILVSHLARPTEGQFDEALSLRPIAVRLSALLKQPVGFVDQHWLEKPESITQMLESHKIVLCENVRFNKGEKKNDEMLSQKIAGLCDVFVMDAFASAHRAESSTVGVAQYAAVACAGPLLVKELDALDKAFKNPKKPLIAIVGGSKVSTKLIVLEQLIEKVDGLILGGGIANTFLKAKGFHVGKSLCELDLIDNANTIMARAAQKGVEIYLPEDVVTAKEFSKTAKAETKKLNDVLDDDMILDVGPKTSEKYEQALAKAGTIIWNGPVGVFEIAAFEKGTQQLALAIAHSAGFSLAGGGDTLSAIDKYAVADKISYISTGGGAFLEFIEGKTLPAIDILEKRAQK